MNKWLKTISILEKEKINLDNTLYIKEHFERIVNEINKRLSDLKSETLSNADSINVFLNRCFVPEKKFFEDIINESIDTKRPKGARRAILLCNRFYISINDKLKASVREKFNDTEIRELIAVNDHLDYERVIKVIFSYNIEDHDLKNKLNELRLQHKEAFCSEASKLGIKSIPDIFNKGLKEDRTELLFINTCYAIRTKKYKELLEQLYEKYSKDILYGLKIAIILCDKEKIESSLTVIDKYCQSLAYIKN